MVDIAPDAPARLAMIAAGYWLFHMAMIFWKGTGWLERGDAAMMPVAAARSWSAVQARQTVWYSSGTRLLPDAPCTASRRTERRRKLRGQPWGQQVHRHAVARRSVDGLRRAHAAFGAAREAQCKRGLPHRRRRR